MIIEVIVLLIKIPVGILLLALWLLVGFLLWLPLMARAIAVFFFLAVSAAVTGNRDTSYGHILQDSIRFFPGGFSLIVRALFSPDEHPGEPIGLGRISLEIFWSIIFWGLLALATIKQPSLNTFVADTGAWVLKILNVNFGQIR